MNKWIRPDKPLVIAHRGNSKMAPENTLSAYRKAIEAKADMLEADVNISMDGVLVMAHDYKLGRTINARGLISDYTLLELRQMDAGSLFHPDFAGERIPTCEETIVFAKEAGIPVCFEIKGGETDRAVVIAEKLMDLFKKYDTFEWTSISTYFPEAAVRARQLAPQLMITRERLPDDAPFDLQDAIAQVRLLESPILLVDFTTVTEKDIHELHDAGIAVWSWNPYKEADVLAAIKMGSDGIIGDDPTLTRRLVDAKG
jgi:glycerophosphoryl diester phosphodiesterase